MLTLAILGDSLTEHWWERRGEQLKRLDTVAYGISAQTSSEIVGRLPVALERTPKYVAILAGTNDIAESEGSFSADKTLSNIDEGVRNIRLAGALPVLCTIPPANNFHWKPAIRPQADIVKLNGEIRDLAARERLPLIEIYQLLSDQKGGIENAYTTDGAHLTDLAYEKMEALLQSLLPLHRH